jgi:hypothetical protein
LRRLTSAHFTAARVGDEVRFEDASILGFVRDFASVPLLLEGWHDAQDQFLRSSAAELRRDRRKAWNAYSFFLTAAQASEDEARALIAIEEDFRSTRKVVRAGVSTDADVDGALSVLLPIRHRVRLSAEDAVGRVADRLTSLPREAVDLLLRDATSEEFAEALLREREGS